MPCYYSDEDIKKKMKVAVRFLLKNDSFLLRESVNERTISHKLAEYLQYQFPDWNVDCEYNRKGLEIKELENIKECDGHRKSDRIYPDIIVHIRNTDFNLLVVELKKKGLNSKCDRKKIELFTESNGKYKYSLGLFLRFSRTCKPKLEWFKDGKPVLGTSD